ncbi:MAG: hypothetical protein ACXW3K_00165 [Brevundimonas sp.]
MIFIAKYTDGKVLTKRSSSFRYTHGWAVTTAIIDKTGRETKDVVRGFCVSSQLATEATVREINSIRKCVSRRLIRTEIVKVAPEEARELPCDLTGLNLIAQSLARGSQEGMLGGLHSAPQTPPTGLRSWL